MNVEQLDLVDVGMATISGQGDRWFSRRRVYRAELVLPTGRDARHDPENRYSVQLVPGGPYMASTQPCQDGKGMSCRSGDCRTCIQRDPTTRHLSAHPRPEAYFQRRDADGFWRLVGDRAAVLLPVHVWRCICTCHEDLFASVDVW